MNQNEDVNEQLSGLITQEQIQTIKTTIDNIKSLTELEQYEDVKNLITYLGKYKNLIDLEREINTINTCWNTFGISDQFYESLENFRNKLNNKAEKFIPIEDVFEDYYKELKHREGISFLNKAINEITGGLLPGNLCTIVGGPGSMKTTTALNICFKAIKQGYNVCYFSLEESPQALYSKLLSRASNDVLPEPFYVSDILRNELNEKDKEILFTKVKPYLDSRPGKLFIVGETDITQYSCFEFENKMKEINILAQERTNNIENNQTHQIDLVIVDHIQLLKYSSNGEDEFKTINKFVSFFRRQALSFLNEKREIAVILLSQVNREGIKYAQKHDGAYLMQHVAEASEIERASSYIISVYSDEMTQLCQQIKIGVIKLRNGKLIPSTIVENANGSFYLVGNVLEDEIGDSNDSLKLEDVIGDSKEKSEVNELSESDWELLLKDFGNNT